MIAALTLLYIGVLAVLVKLKVLKPTKFVKASPILWNLFLFVVFFIPLQYVAPMGRLGTIQNVVQIVPQVAGQVVEVLVTANSPIRRGDVLFRIEPRPYQYQVDKLEAALAEAGVNVDQLRERLSQAEAGVKQARAQLQASETDFDRRAWESLRQAQAQVKQIEANLGVARANFERYSRAAETEAVSRLQLDAARREVESLEAQRNQLNAAEESARLNYEAGGDRVQTVREQLEQALAREREARLAFEARADGFNPRVRQILADLETARFNLGATTVRAPADGIVVNLQLRPGSFVATIPLASGMTFLERGTYRLGVMIRQNHVRLVKPGQEVEMVFEKYPGRVITGRVIAVVQTTSQGQLTPSGEIPAFVPLPSQPFAVTIELVAKPDDIELAGGAMGTAAIYTDSFRPAHVIRQVMMRMDTWLNYMRGIQF